VDVLITGASGLVGTALTGALEARGDRAVALSRSGGVPSWDPSRARIDADAIEGVDAVVHLAGAGIGDKKWTDDRKQEILQSRTKGTRLLAETLAGLDRKPSVCVSASAVGYYGAHLDDEVFTEESSPGSDFLADVCVAWETAITPAEEAGIRVARVRSGVVLSPDGGVLKRMLFPFKMGLGGRIGTGEQYMSWISLDDEVGAILHVLDGDLSGPVNLTAPNPVTNGQYTKTLGDVVRRPTALPTPIRPLKVMYGMELVHHLLLSGQRVLPRRLEASGYPFRHPDLEGALRALLDRPAR